MPIEIDTRVLDRIIRNHPKKVSELVRKTAFKVEQNAKMRAAVDTGAMRNSIYVVTPDSDSYTQAAGAAKAANPNAETSPLPQPTGEFTAHVGPAVEYAVYVELGSHKMAAQPFLVPAVEQERAAWEKAWEDLLKGV